MDKTTSSDIYYYCETISLNTLGASKLSIYK
jgi:hypothetical protein